MADQTAAKMACSVADAAVSSTMPASASVITATTKAIFRSKLGAVVKPLPYFLELA